MNDPNDKRLAESQGYWDNEAPAFDNEPDHGLSDPNVYQAWLKLLSDYVPSTPSQILDIGCGTGSLSVLLAQLGHTVTGIDLSPAMIAQAEAKAQAANQRIEFAVMDAAYPDLHTRKFDVVLCRHILWSLPQQDDVLLRWANLLKPTGRFILIEGYWSAGGGLHAEEVIGAMPKSMSNVHVINLSNRSVLWGGEVTDERYLVVADNLQSET